MAGCLAGLLVGWLLDDCLVGGAVGCLTGWLAGLPQPALRCKHIWRAGKDGRAEANVVAWQLLVCAVQNQNQQHHFTHKLSNHDPSSQQPKRVASI